MLGGQIHPAGLPPAPPPVLLGCWGSARPRLSPDPTSPHPARCRARVSPWCPPPDGCGGGKGGNGSPEEALPWPCHGLSFLRTSDGVGGRERGPRGVTQPGVRGFHAAMSSRGLRKLRCLLPGKGRPFQSLGLWLSQQSLFIWLRGARSIPQRAPGSSRNSNAAAQGIGLGFPVPRAPAACPLVWGGIIPSPFGLAGGDARGVPGTGS